MSNHRFSSYYTINSPKRINKSICFFSIFQRHVCSVASLFRFFWKTFASDWIFQHSFASSVNPFSFSVCSIWRTQTHFYYSILLASSCTISILSTNCALWTRLHQNLCLHWRIIHMLIWFHLQSYYVSLLHCETHNTVYSEENIIKCNLYMRILQPAILCV